MSTDRPSRGLPGAYATKENPAEATQRHDQWFHQVRQQMARRIAGARDLLGDGVAASLERPFEDLCEHHGEAIYHHQAALAAAIDERAAVSEKAIQETTALRFQLAEVRQLLRLAAEEEHTRFQRRRPDIRVHAGWFMDARDRGHLDEPGPF